MTNQSTTTQRGVLTFHERERILLQFIREPINQDRELAIAIESAAQSQLLAPVADYESVLADHRRLVRELDALLNGDGAAAQGSLCDIVAQVKRTGIKASAPVANERALPPLPHIPTSYLQLKNLDKIHQVMRDYARAALAAQPAAQMQGDSDA